jgi:hypothetical protein
MDVVIARRFRGPRDSGNGGYSCGVFAGGRDAAVTLRLPPPLETPLAVEVGVVRDGERVVAELADADVGLEPPKPVPWEEAVAARLPDLGSPFPECFVCGHARGDDALHIHAGPVAGRGLVAAPWEVRVDQVGPEFVWAVLDCPGAYATGVPGRGIVVLGRLAAHVERVPEAGERCVVVGWSLGDDGRKHDAGTAVFDESGGLVGIGRAVWIEPRAAVGVEEVQA